MGMSTPDPGAPTLSDALVREMKAEMGRHEIGSVRALAVLLGDNNVYWNDRLNRKGKRVPVNIDDLGRFCDALGIDPWDLVHRAKLAAQRGHQQGGGGAGTRHHAG